MNAREMASLSSFSIFDPLFLTLLVHDAKKSSRVLWPNQMSELVQILKATCELTSSRVGLWHLERGSVLRLMPV